MKTFVRLAVTALTVAVVCQTGLALAEDYYWVSGDAKTATDAKTASPAADAKAAPAAQTQTPCSSGCCQQSSCACGCCDESCSACPTMGCDGCPGHGLVAFAGFDSFKGISDSFLPSNFGVVTGINAATPIPGLKDYGIGWQLGMSYGIYDFDGRVTAVDAAQSQQQVFVTTGFFRKATCDQRLSFGLVYDWMMNTNWGILPINPTLGQWRGQIEYAFSGSNSIGLWGCQRDLGAEEVLTVDIPGVTTIGLDARTRAISQVNLFWHHKFCSGADSYLWFGVPDHGRFDEDGSVADWAIGATVQAPLTDALALYANASYLHPSAAAGIQGAIDAGYDVGMGVVWYFGRHAVSHSINGDCWEPYMAVANNSTFLVEQGLGVTAP